MLYASLPPELKTKSTASSLSAKPVPEQVYDAAAAGDVNELRRLVQAGAGVNQTHKVKHILLTLSRNGHSQPVLHVDVFA
jgi:hypothetical protein